MTSSVLNDHNLMLQNPNYSYKCQTKKLEETWSRHKILLKQIRQKFSIKTHDPKQPKTTSKTKTPHPSDSHTKPHSTQKPKPNPSINKKSLHNPQPSIKTSQPHTTQPH